MPTPKKNEKKKEFIDRCMNDLIGKEGKDRDQAYAICQNIWKDKDKSEVVKVPDKKLFRSSVVYGIKPKEGQKGVDREFIHDKGVGAIFGYSVITKGKLSERDPRDWEMDDKSLDQIVELGNQLKIGKKSRFGHPNMSSEALGTFLGRAKNFRREEDDVVRADLFFDESSYKTPKGDLATYVMDLAESDPKSFGTSVVFDYDMEYRLNSDGTRQKNKKGKNLPGLIRFKKLFASDVVESPAATKGLFEDESFFNGNVELSAKATEFLDKLLCDQDSLNKVISFLGRYQENKEIEMAEDPKEIVTEEQKNTLFAEQFVTMLKESNATVLEALKNQGYAKPEEVEDLNGKIAELSAQVSILQKVTDKISFDKRILEVKEELNEMEAIGDVNEFALKVVQMEQKDFEMAKFMLDEKRKAAQQFKALGLDIEIGSRQDGKILNTVDSAFKKLEEKVIKVQSEKQLDGAKAWRQVIKENPELYKEYTSKQHRKAIYDTSELNPGE